MIAPGDLVVIHDEDSAYYLWRAEVVEVGNIETAGGAIYVDSAYVKVGPHEAPLIIARNVVEWDGAIW